MFELLTHAENLRSRPGANVMGSGVSSRAAAAVAGDHGRHDSTAAALRWQDDSV